MIVRSSLGGDVRLRCLRRLRRCCAFLGVVVVFCRLLVLLGKGQSQSRGLFLLQTCMCRISFVFNLLGTRTFGGVIKFCVICLFLLADGLLSVCRLFWMSHWCWVWFHMVVWLFFQYSLVTPRRPQQKPAVCADDCFLAAGCSVGFALAVQLATSRCSLQVEQSWLAISLNKQHIILNTGQL